MIVICYCARGGVCCRPQPVPALLRPALRAVAASALSSQVVWSVSPENHRFVVRTALPGVRHE